MQKDKIDEIVEDLTKIKDELTLQANLGVAEAKDELEKLEPLYEDLKVKASKIADVAGDTAAEIKAAAELGIDAKTKDEIYTALELTGEQLKDAYKRIKEIF